MESSLWPHLQLVGAHLCKANVVTVKSESVQFWLFQVLGKKIPSSKLTWQWKIPIFNSKYIFNWSIFHCHVSLPEGNDCHDWIGNKRIYYPYDTFIIISYLIRNPIFKVISNHFPPFVFWISFRGLVLQCLPFVHYINIKNSPLKKK